MVLFLGLWYLGVVCAWSFSQVDHLNLDSDVYLFGQNFEQEWPLFDDGVMKVGGIVHSSIYCGVLNVKL